MERSLNSSYIFHSTKWIFSRYLYKPLQICDIFGQKVGTNFSPTTSYMVRSSRVSIVKFLVYGFWWWIFKMGHSVTGKENIDNVSAIVSWWYWIAISRIGPEWSDFLQLWRWKDEVLYMKRTSIFSSQFPDLAHIVLPRFRKTFLKYILYWLNNFWTLNEAVFLDVGGFKNTLFNQKPSFRLHQLLISAFVVTTRKILSVKPLTLYEKLN